MDLANTLEISPGTDSPFIIDKGCHAERTQSQYTEATDYFNMISEGQPVVQRIRFDISRFCNLGCAYCVCKMGKTAPSSVKDQCIDFDVFKQFVEVFKSMQTKMISLYGGGEPFAHPNIIDIIELLDKSGIQMQFLTNGSMFNSKTKDTLDKYAKSITSIRFSVHGISEKSYLQNTGKNLFNKVIDDVIEVSKRLKSNPSFDGQIGVYVPIIDSSQMIYEDIDFFIEKLKLADIDYLWFSEDTRFPWPDKPNMFKNPEVQKYIHKKSTDTPNFVFQYTTPAAIKYNAKTCFQELLYMFLTYDSKLKKVLRVRCPNFYPKGLYDLPPEGKYQVISPDTLIDNWTEHISNRLSTDLDCPDKNRCMSYRRNATFLKMLEQK